jgi:hypothetical protein
MMYCQFRRDEIVEEIKSKSVVGSLYVICFMLLKKQGKSQGRAARCLKLCGAKATRDLGFRFLTCISLYK